LRSRANRQRAAGQARGFFTVEKKDSSASIQSQDAERVSLFQPGLHGNYNNTSAREGVVTGTAAGCGVTLKKKKDLVLLSGWRRSSHVHKRCSTAKEGGKLIETGPWILS